MPTSDHSGTFLPGDVVKVPFPYTDRPTRQRRPALIVSSPDLQREHGLSWVLMITSAANRGWKGDVDVADLAQAGLPARSVVRTAKIATIDSRDADYLGRVAPEILDSVRQHLGAIVQSTRGAVGRFSGA
ncbi:MAG: type II toxin-antitoxin system PemK/MazF family toxin [Chromatiaceae bacterium]|jgi:mRNA interferase MazF|nr:type II toxin-antitoxin system PemK/MazF family toxin [Chromatiaceae bacterium]